jgi:hypothetical protein
MWLSVSQTLPMLSTPICTYSPPRGKNKELFCCSIAVGGSSFLDWRCSIHTDRIGRGGSIIEKNITDEYHTTLLANIIPVKPVDSPIRKSQVSPRRSDSPIFKPVDSPIRKSQGRPAILKKDRWFTPKKFIEIVRDFPEHYCAYSPFKGVNKELICGSLAYKYDEEEWGPNFWNYRCTNCWGKRGVSQGLLLSAAMNLLRGDSSSPKEKEEEEMPGLVNAEPLPYNSFTEEVDFVPNDSLTALLGDGWYIMLGEKNYLTKCTKKETCVYGYLKLDNPGEDNITLEMLDDIEGVDSEDRNFFISHNVKIYSPSVIWH